MKLFKTKSPTEIKTWDRSQRYELEHAIGFMQEPFFQDLHAGWRAGRLNASTGHRDSLMLSEFFGNSLDAFNDFFRYISGKKCLDIGPCVYSPLAAWDVAGQRFVIEPLLQPIHDWQLKNFGRSSYEALSGFNDPAERIKAELIGKIEGAILCRNMLDHTPHWPFVLANISTYAAPGCKLLLWTDLHHRGDADEGHYDITEDIPAFKNLIVQLGFRVIREHTAQRHELNWGCFAEKER